MIPGILGACPTLQGIAHSHTTRSKSFDCRDVGVSFRLDTCVRLALLVAIAYLLGAATGRSLFALLRRSYEGSRRARHNVIGRDQNRANAHVGPRNVDQTKWRAPITGAKYRQFLKRRTFPLNPFRAILQVHRAASLSA
jgi:hypothetical protein